MNWRPDLSAAFDAAMADCGPFEPQPVIAIGVSGGGDSLALLLLAQEWATLRGGTVVALSVDHRLRAGAMDELRHVGEVCAGQGIAHHVLVWQHEGVASAVQSRARRARYDLMSNWCREAGILHLAVAHTAEDQAETQAMRIERAPSGPGVAGMASVRLEQGVRLLRPLLGQSGKDLRGYLKTLSIDWVEDPSNQDRRFERVRKRQDMHDVAPGVDEVRRRISRDQKIAELASKHLSLSPAGFAVMRREVLSGDEYLSVSLIAHVLRTVSGSAYLPPADKVTGLRSRLAGPDRGGMTLGGCLLIPDNETILITREYQISETICLNDALKHDWDGRFRLQVSDGFCHRKMSVGPAGKCTVSLRPIVGKTGISLPVVRGLPALYRDDEFAGLVPCGGLSGGLSGISARFVPRNPLVPLARWLVPPRLPPILELANRS